ncbi:tetraacyldisaccharide 4'-kinase [Sphingobacterium bovistauri]|uniref:Tetraacyldisaccharide 4'-kinase n=1 Tax=Sphingobacterium bovistauri TaxID=2781959 RepID=A0ABS7Z5F4_9SPHI|nr:tetraacyldisaccharide 4'-kinase [Sphingobacterium bovistauri]MCA5005389.1 tetraacyldisaccharide 4'-kinase [Sphingobacterium bovistauri]
MITILRWILFPITVVYHSIIWLRNLLYDKGIFKSQSFKIPTIVIGNLAIGGTGKSPMTEYLIKLLQDKYSIATLSRGYGRKTKGYRLVNVNSKALEVGDEPLQFKNKFPNITVAVDEDRCEGIKQLQNNHDIIILDDAFQHRKLRPGYAILLFDFNSLFKPILTLPTGDFRDIFSSTKRADLIIITKCPENINDKEKHHIEHIIRKYNIAPIFYTKIGYENPKSLSGSIEENKLENKEILLFCGIANPTPLVEYLEKYNNTVHLLKFPDHHNFSQDDFEKIKNKFNSIDNTNKLILTTEKDTQRIPADVFISYPVYYMPIHLQSADNQQVTFDHFIENYLSSHQGH